MSWLPKREKLDPVQASAIDFVVAQEGNFYIKGEAGTGKSVVLAHVAAKFKHDNPGAKVAALTYTNAFAACLGEGLKDSGVDVQTILRFKAKEQYDLIVVDEAQDIRLDWVNRLKKRGKKFVFAGDFTQMIFGETVRVITEKELISKFEITQQPIELKRDYRLPMSQRELLGKVYRFGHKFVSAVVNEQHKPRITLYHAKDWTEEMKHADEYLQGKIGKRKPAAILFNTNHKIRKFLEAVVPGLKKKFDGTGDMAFLAAVNDFLVKKESPYRYLGKGYGDLLESNERPLAYAMSWHGSKGLDFETIAPPDLGRRGANVRANTFYVAMTRSRKNLMMSYSGEAGDQTERARTCDVVEFFSGIQGDYEQGELL